MAAATILTVSKTAAPLNNPLLLDDFLIRFRDITAEHIVPAVKEAIREAEQQVATIVQASGPHSYDSLVGALDRLEERTDRIITVCSHLNAVSSTNEVREAYQQVLPLYSRYSNGLRSNQELWAVLKDYAASPEAAGLPPVRRRRLDNLLREFTRQGADLSQADREQLQELFTELAELQNRFGENVLDATAAFELHLTDEADLSGLPASAMQAAAAAARERDLDGWVITLHQPSVMPFLQYADNRELRRKVQQAYANRAADGERDNRPLIRRILQLRREIARLLGFTNFADFRLDVNMVGSGSNADSFIADLTTRTEPYWREEADRLAGFARSELGLEQLEAWDMAWATEKLRRQELDFDSEELRPYFSHGLVMDGLFTLTERLFGITIREVDNDQVWHEDVRFYEMADENGVHIASFYADWFPRSGKRGGAWMNSFVTGGPRPDGSFDPHLALIMGNLTPPVDGKPARFTHREVQTVFHEFGHLLHQCLSRVSERALGGTHVQWDWVELPSQIMENWTTEPEALELIARHADTGESLPADLLGKLRAASTFMGGHAQMRQLSFGAIDLALHTRFDPASDEDPVEFAIAERSRFVARPEMADDAFICGFTHLFSGAYAAAYYSYKWSEVLEADAFTRFRDEGIFNETTGRDFRDFILATGNSEDPNELYRRFMGRGPAVDALIERNLALVPAAQGSSPASSASGSLEAPSE